MSVCACLMCNPFFFDWGQARARGAESDGPVEPQELWLGSHRQVVGAYSLCFVPLEDHRWLRLALENFTMSLSAFPNCPKLVSKLYILMLNETPSPSCKSHVVVGATPILGWRNCSQILSPVW